MLEWNSTLIARVLFTWQSVALSFDREIETVERHRDLITPEKADEIIRKDEAEKTAILPYLKNAERLCELTANAEEPSEADMDLFREGMDFLKREYPGHCAIMKFPEWKE